MKSCQKISLQSSQFITTLDSHSLTHSVQRKRRETHHASHTSANSARTDGTRGIAVRGYRPDRGERHRSHDAYARVIGRNTDKAASLGMGGFYACSGAKTQNIAYNGTDSATAQANEGIQTSHLNANTKVVTLTIGGNDVGFEGFATGCFDPSSSCAINSAVYNTTLGKINNELPGKLSVTYQAILNAAPNAQIYVLGYPQVASVKTASDPADLKCLYLYDGGTDWADAQGARSIVTKLDEKIEQKVNDVRAMNAGNTRLHYIDPNASGSPFVGHTVCAEEADSFFNNADQALPPGQVRFVFHPNQRGQEAYAQLVAEALN